jgi:hypothetical protein
MSRVVKPERQPIAVRWQNRDQRTRRSRREHKQALRRAEQRFTAAVRSGEIWFVSRWVPVSPGARIGHVSYTDNYCAACMWRRMRPVEDA